MRGRWKRLDVTAALTTHGMSRTPEYKAYRNMMSRCYNRKVPKFENHGGRGISVSAEWRSSFEVFFADVGKRPSRRHTLERIDNDGNYERGNVHWATYAEQNRNLRSNRLINFRGETLCLTDWALKIGLKPSTLSCRIFGYGWPIARALTEAVNIAYRKKGSVAA